MSSTFNSPVVGSAYFYSRASGSRQVCRSTGYGLLQTLQTTVLDVLVGSVDPPNDGNEPAIGTLPSAGGSSVSVEQMQAVSPANGWDDTTLRALYAFVQFSAQQSTANRSTIQAYLPSIAEDILRRSGRLSERTMKAVAWVSGSMGFTADGRRVYGLSSPDSVSFDANTVFPNYGEVPPRSTTGSTVVDCTPIAEGEAASDPITTTATLGVSPWLIVALIGVTVVAIGAATRGARSNPSGDELEFRRRQSLPGVKSEGIAASTFEGILLTRRGQFVGSKRKMYYGRVLYHLPPIQKAAT